MLKERKRYLDMGPFKYKVIYSDETTFETITTTGLVFADSFSNATSQITQYYGDNNIVYLALDAWEAIGLSLIEINEETLQQIEEQL